MPQKMKLTFLVALLLSSLAIQAIAQQQTTNQRQANQRQPSIAFGMAKISLGMTIQQVEQNLAGAGRHIQMLQDKETAIVYRNGITDDSEGQITFYDGRVAFAQFAMPNANSAEDLALEIASAVDSMESNTCDASNFSAHGTGGEQLSFWRSEKYWWVPALGGNR